MRLIEVLNSADQQQMALYKQQILEINHQLATFVYQKNYLRDQAERILKKLLDAGATLITKYDIRGHEYASQKK